MSSQESEQVLTLLKELAMLKELDNVAADELKTESERDVHQECQQRRAEIGEQIKAVAEQKKNGVEPCD